MNIEPTFMKPENRFREMINLDFVFQPCVFLPSEDNEFPKGEFINPEKAKALLGNYKIDVVFYSKDFKIVDTAKDLGRYGAVVKITAQDGIEYIRYRTLFRCEETKPILVDDPLEGTILFPKYLGLDYSIWKNQSQTINTFITAAIERDKNRSHEFAILLSGLSEIDSDCHALSQLDSAITRDRRWWLKLKQKINGSESRVSEIPVSTRTENSISFPLLIEGTENTAGMESGVIQKLDKILNTWLEESSEPFNVCVARKGILFFNQGYGKRNGEPVTPDTKHLVYSITKAISGTLFMIFVEKGLVKLDDPVSNILPHFSDKKIETPVTFRHLFTHTADMDEHFTDTWNDLEQIYGEAYPYLNIGREHRYNGTSIGIALKALEYITGMTLPDLYQKYLFGPLGCQSIESIDGSALTWSNAYDLAIIGQMLCNRGTYNKYLFFSEEKFGQMLPQKLNSILGPNTDITWGIGLTEFKEGGLDKKTIGHGSASSCTLRVDLKNELVISMTRARAGENFENNHEKFISAITSSIIN
tara:strand:- start:171 stop:1763 length:1593 start_codon:yes stop_codon:yes gene_type:complete